MSTVKFNFTCESIIKIVKDLLYNKNFIILNLCIAANVINVGFFWNKTYLSFIIALLLLIIVWTLDFTKFGVNKIMLILTSILISFNGPILEHIMIFLSKHRCWTYGNPYKLCNTSLFLFPGYGIMGSSGIILYHILKYYL